MDNRRKSKPTTGHVEETMVEKLAEVITPDHLSEEDDHRMVIVNEKTIDEYNLDFITGESKESLLWQAARAEEKGEVVTVLLFDYNRNMRELDQFHIKSDAAKTEDGNLSAGPIEIRRPIKTHKEESDGE